MAVTKRTRFEVLRRDNYTCRYCRSVENELTVDHVTPVALGGTDDPGNLVAACKDCNAGKTSTSPDADLIAQVEEDHLRWTRAIKAAAQIRAQNINAADEYVRTFEEVWGPRYIPNGGTATLQRLYESGLPVEDLHQAAMLAISARGVLNSRFSYFCGIAWRRVTELQARAKQLLIDGEVV